MNDIKLYEKIPKELFPVRIHCYMDQNYDFTSHWHEHTEIHCIFAGEGEMNYGQERYNVRAGDCLVINGNELHGGTGGTCDYLCLIIPPELFEKNHVIFKKLIRDKDLSDICLRIFKRYLSRSSADLLEIKGLVYLLISILIRTHTEKNLGEAYSKYFSRLGKVNGAVQFINDNYDKRLNTKMLAEKVHLSEGYFCQIFKEVTGKTAIEYISGVRIEKAEKLLEKTDMTVTEIAMLCGFDDANYFSRIFKKLKGVSPTSLRALKY